MIGTIRKHSKALWFVIIAVVIVTFVFWGSQPSGNKGSGGQGPAGPVGVIGGEPITHQDVNSAANEALIAYRLQAGRFPDDVGTFDLEREAFNRLFMIRKMDAMDIHISDET